ncbi:MAG: transposase [Verrucomicrobia bacterium]|nr:transposase [Verrucomicrobiota bacterium]
MNNQHAILTAQAGGVQVASAPKAAPGSEAGSPPYRQIKLALDVHAADLMVVRMVDGAKPQPPQKMTPNRFLEWALKQKSQAQEVISCYEAGPTGFWLHRQLSALGIRNYVVCPSCLDERCSGVNNDRTDALELATRLDRFLAGNEKALAIVRVPTEAQEQKRARNRQRQQLRQQRLSLAAQGRSLMLLHGIRETNNWWKPARWAGLAGKLAPWLVERLEVFRPLIIAIDQSVGQLTEQIQAGAPKVLPKGMGSLTHENIDGEVVDWTRFGNRRQAGSYAGLSGGVSASGQSAADLSITKAGNKRLRTELVEVSWRMVFYQPEYYLVQKWKHILLNPKAKARARKRAIIAFARQLLVDWWRWKTGRKTAEQLGWVMTAA